MIGKIYRPVLSVFDTFNHPSVYFRPNLGHSFRKIVPVIKVINFLFYRFNYWVILYNTKLSFYNTKKNHLHTNVIITQTFLNIL
jgi:hypothetical protein